MARKTFIKVRVGILEPKHIFQIGSAIWLYLYILNRADWKTGKIFDWRDNDAAADLGVYVQSIRNQRNRLQVGLYISSVQKHHRLEITVNNWHDPTEKVINENHGDKKISLPSNDGDSHGDMDGDSHGDRNLSSLLFNQELRSKNKEYIDDSEKLLSIFAKTFDIEYIPRSLIEKHEWENILTRLDKAGITPKILLQVKANMDKRVTHPAQIISECGRLLNAGAVNR